ncbi:hypothetical protein L53_11580 [Hyphomonas sp. L-53-1-40]|uniref:hypothetical protein n=1 Tax=Hyphomonas sp. L-53-1-40 TaxID=1207058 RepID=UPI0004590E82|nr:hypothetical protein [Hyphomonas sp. L-53-1-40]KCZ62733.1 hypothetical protein L53_11580 [Hyphomonas sp. L-53-1-40]
MDAQTDILKRGLEHAALAVMDASALANLHLGPKRIGRGLAQRVSGRLRILEIIVRRLILLMAPAPPRPAPANPAPEPDLPEGVELAIFPRLSPRRLTLLPARQAFEGPGGFPDMSGTSYGPVSPHKLMARIAALRRVIAAPEAHATRLARTLKRLQKSGEPRPVVGAATPAFRLSPELGAMAAMLPAQISAGLESWESSG